MASRVVPSVSIDQHTSLIPSNRLSLTQSEVQNSSVTRFVIPDGVLLTPTAAQKRRMKQKDHPESPTGTIFSSRELFNRLYRAKMRELNGSAPTNEHNPLYSELVKDIKDNTYSAVKRKYADKLRDLKRMLVGKYSVLTASQSCWVVTFLIKETMQRDSKAVVEAAKKEAKNNAEELNRLRAASSSTANQTDAISSAQRRKDDSSPSFNPAQRSTNGISSEVNPSSNESMGSGAHRVPSEVLSSGYNHQVRSGTENDQQLQHMAGEYPSASMKTGKGNKASGGRRARKSKDRRLPSTHSRRCRDTSESDVHCEREYDSNSASEVQFDEPKPSRRFSNTSQAGHLRKRRRTGRVQKQPDNRKNQTAITSDSESDEIEA